MMLETPSSSQFFLLCSKCQHKLQTREEGWEGRKEGRREGTNQTTIKPLEVRVPEFYGQNIHSLVLTFLQL